MKPRSVIFGVIFVVAVLFVGSRLLSPDDARIRSLLVDLVEGASVAEGESELAGFAKAREISLHFLSDCQVAVADSGDVGRGRDGVARSVAWARADAGPVEFRADEVEVVVHGEDRADARVLVLASGPDGPISAHDETRLSFKLEKEQGRWLIASVWVERP